MNECQQQSVQCPYCGELIELSIDFSAPNQSYIEDCSVCCHPINIAVDIDFDQQVHLQVTHENE